VGEPLTTQAAVSAKLLRPLTDGEDAVMDALIAEASALLRWARPSIDEDLARWPTAGIDPDVVTAMLASVIKRLLINPNGLVSSSETEGDYSISENYGTVTSTTGDLQITAADLAKLLPPGATRRGSICTPARGYVAGRRYG
jgi:hypothetical protein